MKSATCHAAFSLHKSYQLWPSRASGLAWKVMQTGLVLEVTHLCVIFAVLLILSVDITETDSSSMLFQMLMTFTVKKCNMHCVFMQLQ